MGRRAHGLEGVWGAWGGRRGGCLQRVRKVDHPHCHTPWLKDEHLLDVTAMDPVDAHLGRVLVTDRQLHLPRAVSVHTSSRAAASRQHAARRWQGAAPLAKDECHAALGTEATRLHEGEGPLSKLFR